MTPPRLTELECPQCQTVTWVMASDYSGIDGVCVPYGERHYRCVSCHYDHRGWKLLRQSPPEFLLQPHDLYPMTQVAFDYWVEILRSHFPQHPAIAGLGTTFIPRLPEEVAAAKAAHARRHPVELMTDQDGARRAEPVLKDVFEWIELMRPGHVLHLHRRDGGLLTLTLDQSGNSATCLDAAGKVLAQATALDVRLTHELSRKYLGGDVRGCVRRLHNGNQAR